MATAALVVVGSPRWDRTASVGRFHWRVVAVRLARRTQVAPASGVFRYPDVSAHLGSRVMSGFRVFAGFRQRRFLAFFFVLAAVWASPGRATVTYCVGSVQQFQTAVDAAITDGEDIHIDVVAGSYSLGADLTHVGMKKGDGVIVRLRPVQQRIRSNG